MKIAVNTRLLIPNRMEGIARFIYETSKRIVKSNPQHQFYFLFDRPFDSKFIFGSNVTPVVLGPPTRHPILWYYWFEHRLPAFFKYNNIDCFYSGDNYLSLKANIPSLLVSHDLAFHHFPEHLPYLTHKYYNYFAPKYHHRANKIIAVSEATKRDIIQSYRVSPDKIRVAYNDVPKGFKAISESQKIAMRNKYAAGSPYFFYLGSIHPRKNVKNLILAFDAYKNKHDSDYKLLIAGRMAWKNKELMECYMSLKNKEDIVFLKDFQNDIKDLMGAASAFVYISLFEGFGIPILEAFHAGIPVISSNISSMPEVCADAALLVDPRNIDQISDAMHRLVNDEELRLELASKSGIQKNKFSWDRTAEIVSDEINKLVPQSNK